MLQPPQKQHQPPLHLQPLPLLPLLHLLLPQPPLPQQKQMLQGQLRLQLVQLMQQDPEQWQHVLWLRLQQPLRLQQLQVSVVEESISAKVSHASSR